jgi:hypothetical protein
MIGEISAALQSIKTAHTIIKGIQSLKNEVEIKQQASELLSVILDLQSDIFNLQSKYDELIKDRHQLELKIKSYDDWKSIKKDYSLLEIEHGYFVYSQNNKYTGSEPKHWLCTNCFENKRKSILIIKRPGFYDDYICPNCKNTFTLRDSKKPTSKQF